MLPLILGLMCGAKPQEISRLMDETTKRHQEAAAELRKKEEAKKAQIEYEREKFEAVIDEVYEELEKYECLVGSENMQERLLDELDNVCYKMKIDR
jgi:alanyl-tRNA synthetase